MIAQTTPLTASANLLVGLLFGLGLMLSGMTDPGKVIGFLDLFGSLGPLTWRWSWAAPSWSASSLSPSPKNAPPLFWAACCASPPTPDIDKTLGHWQFDVWCRLGLGWVFAPAPPWSPWPMANPKR